MQGPDEPPINGIGRRITHVRFSIRKSRTACYSLELALATMLCTVHIGNAAEPTSPRESPTPRGATNPQLAEAERLSAEVAAHYRAGEYAQAIPKARRALQLGEAELGPDHPNVAASLNNLAELLRNAGRYAEAEPLYRR